LEPHEVKISENYPESVFWVKSGIVIVDIESQNFWSNVLSIQTRLIRLFLFFLPCTCFCL
jgi:hypothetical protein